MSGGREPRATAVLARNRQSGSDTGRLAVSIFALLVLASLGAFFLAQRLKHTPTAVQQLKLDPAFYPEGGGVPREEALSFDVERKDEVTVQVISTQGRVVATLASKRLTQAYENVLLHWDGNEGLAHGRLGPSGRPAPEGEYKVKVILAHRKLQVSSPTPFILVRGGKE